MADGTDPNASQGGQSVVLDGNNWGQFIPDDLKDDLNFKPFEGKPVGEVFRSFVNAQRMIGGDKVIVPAGKFDTPEVWNEVFSKLGRPGNADGYQFDPPTLPSGVQLDPEFDKTFKDISHYLGLLPWQAKGLYQLYHEKAGANYESQVTAMTQKQRETMEQAEATLKTEFGAKYADKIDLAKRVIRTYGGKPEEVNQFLERYGNDPIAIRTLVKLGDLVSEDRIKTGERPEWDTGAEGARKKAVDIMSNATNPLHGPYLNKSHPQHLEAVNEVERLFELSAQ
jgi:hypothetical protein